MTIFPLPQNAEMRFNIKHAVTPPVTLPTAATDTADSTNLLPSPPPPQSHIYHNMAQTYNVAPFVSHSLYHQYTHLYKLLNEQLYDGASYASVIRILHPFSVTSVPYADKGSGADTTAAILPLNYDMIEIITAMNILAPYVAMPIKAVHIGQNHAHYQYLNVMRNSSTPITALGDKYFYFHENIGDTINCTFHYIYYDLDMGFSTDLTLCNIKNYVIQFVRALLFILKCQQDGGIAILKTSHMFCKPIVQLVYLLTGMYEKAYIVKPGASNIIEHDRYIVCRGFMCPEREKHHAALSEWLDMINHTISTDYVENMEELLSPLSDKIPLPFLYKINEINIIIGCKQLEAMEHLTYVLKNRHKTGKLDELKRNCHTRYLEWCKKFIAVGYINKPTALIYNNNTNI